MSKPDPTNYSFVVEYSTDDDTWRWVELEIREHDDLARRQYLGIWHKLCQSLQSHHDLGGLTQPPQWVSWKPGEWCNQKKGYERRLQYVASAGPNLVGFLNCWPNVPSVEDQSKELLYVEHVATAPGNIQTDLWRRKFRYVGQALLAYAVLLSQLHGFDGRIGLHVAGAEAIGFYRRISERDCQGKLFRGERTGISGPTPRGEAEQAKIYLETVETEATNWLETYRKATT